MRILFVTPHILSSGEAVTALHAAEQAIRRGAQVRFLASPHTLRFIARRHPETVSELTPDLVTNRRLLDSLLRDFRPDVVLFADYALLTEQRGGLPLVDDAWPALLDRLDAALVTFDHLGLEQEACELGWGRIARPPRMHVLLPCPLHEPCAVPRRCGIPFRAFEPPTLTETERHEARSALESGRGGYVLFHGVASWASKMAESRSNSLYARLPALLEDYFGWLPAPVTLVSVNDGKLLRDAPRGTIRILNLPPLPVQRYEALMCSSDLVLTENCFSMSVGKAVCADVPAVAWRNSFDLSALVSRLGPETPPSILDMILHQPQTVESWLAFPGWPLALERELRVFEGNHLTEAFSRLELFGGDETVDSVHQLLLDAATAQRLREARRAYSERVTRLPDFTDALVEAVSSHEIRR